MKISLDGFLLRTADEMPLRPTARQPQPQLTATVLRGLHSNLAELATRMDAGDGDAALREFFSVYVIRRGSTPSPEST